MSNSPLISRPRPISTPSLPFDDEKESFPFVLNRKEGIDGLSPHTDVVIRKEKVQNLKILSSCYFMPCILLLINCLFVQEFRASSPIGRSVDLTQLDGHFGQTFPPPVWDRESSKKMSPPPSTPPQHICNLFGCVFHYLSSASKN
jgi:hypothetical protein